jgi:formylglycine-generating enzyme required for sulfatase activity
MLTVRFALVVAILPACGASEGSSSDPVTDAAVAAPDAAEAVCDDVTRRAVLEGPFACDASPEVVEVQGETHRFAIFKYEASHPLATADLAFPCAASQGESWEAPDERTAACSREGVRPWHSVRWSDASAACEAAGEGFRLCTNAELVRACEGPEGYAYAFGNAFDAQACNIRQVYETGGAASEAPTGDFAECVSSEGVVDINGNVWEWNGDIDAADRDAHVYQGAGWRIIPEMHRETDQTCAKTVRLPGLSARSFASSNVGFRCCKNL